eukprot:PhM_4_TR15058/c0_g1_i1/m.50432
MSSGPDTDSKHQRQLSDLALPTAVMSPTQQQNSQLQQQQQQQPSSKNSNSTPSSRHEHHHHRGSRHHHQHHYATHSKTGKPVRTQVAGQYLVRNERLGVGSFATVYRGTCTKTNTEVAVKIVDIKKLTPEKMKYVRNEVKQMRNLKHENVVSLLDSQYNDNHVLLVMELCEGGDLQGCIARRRNAETGRALSEPEARHLFRQLMRGVEFLSDQCKMHRDLKSANLLLTDSDPMTTTLKIADFGLVKDTSQLGVDGVMQPQPSMSDTICGTPLYMAPERMRQGYGMASDIFSCGIILFEMLFGHVPFQGTSVEEIIKHARRGLKDALPPRHDLSFFAVHLLEQLLRADPEKRPTPREVLMHPWLQDAASSPGTPLHAPAQQYQTQHVDPNASCVSALSGDSLDQLRSAESIPRIESKDCVIPPGLVQQTPTPSKSQSTPTPSQPDKTAKSPLQKEAVPAETAEAARPQSPETATGAMLMSLRGDVTQWLEYGTAILEAARDERNPAHAAVLFLYSLEAAVNASASWQRLPSDARSNPEVAPLKSSMLELHRATTASFQNRWEVIGTAEEGEVPPPQQLLWDRAVQCCQDGAVEESLGNVWSTASDAVTAHSCYRRARGMLMGLAKLEQNLSPSDKEVCEVMLQQVQRRWQRTNLVKG